MEIGKGLYQGIVSVDSVEDSDRFLGLTKGMLNDWGIGKSVLNLLMGFLGGLVLGLGFSHGDKL